MNMVKKLLLGLIPLLLIGAGACYYFYIERGYSFGQRSVYDAVPPETPVFLQINDPVKLIEAIDHSDSLTSAIFTVESFSDVKTLAQTLNEILSANDDLKNAMASHKVLLTLNIEGKESVRSLFVWSMNNSSESDLLENVFENEVSKRKWDFSKRKYNEKNIYEASDKSGKRKLSMALGGGLAMFSLSSLQIENAIIQLDGTSLLENPDFLKVSKTAGVQSEIGVYVNHETIGKLLTKYGSPKSQKWISYCSSFSNWSEFDFSSMGKQIYMSGFSNSSSEASFYTDVLKTQKTVQSKMEDLLPKETAFFLSLSLSDYSRFQQSYSEFISDKKSYGKTRSLLEKVQQQGCDLQKYVGEFFDQDAAFLGLYDQKTDSISNKLFLLETKSGSVALEKMKELQLKYLAANNIDKNSLQKELEIDDQTTITLYRFPFTEMAEILFGNLYSGVKTKWFASLGNYLVFSDKVESFIPFFKANMLGETLAKNIDYQKFKSELTSRSNLILFCNTEYAMKSAVSFFEEPLASELLSSTEIAKFRYLCWQIGASPDRVYNSACFQFVPNKPLKQKYVWQISVDAPIATSPQMVRNATDKRTMEFMVQDEKNNLYLINQTGRVQWKRKLDGSILGTIFQIEPNRDGSLQYAMNTENSIYVIDKDGENVSGFPILLNDKATSPLSVFDYERNREYRLFVACSDKKIRAYGIDGNPVEGWNPFTTDHEVTRPVKHFRVEGKDYIVAADAMKDYILDRKGSIRVKTDAVYAHSSLNDIFFEDRNSFHSPRFVTTDQQGIVHYSDFEGKHFQHAIDSLDDRHFFVSTYLNSDDRQEYIVSTAETLKLFDSDRSLEFEHTFDAPISLPPSVVKLPSGKRVIKVVCASINRIFLLDEKGELCPGFPLEGNSNFLIIPQYNEKSKFNVIVANSNGQLNNYIVE